MHRPTRKDTDAPAHDSFLDIVANMVGILIILVMVVGVRVKNAPIVTAIPSKPPEAVAEAQKELAAEQSLRGDVLEAAEEIRRLQAETIVQKRQRHALATIAAAMEQEIQSRRRQMDAETREDFDLRRSLSESQYQLEQLAGERDWAKTDWAETDRAKPILVEHHPTPLSRTVDGDEAHFQIRGGRVAFIPFEPLLRAAKADVRLKTSGFMPKEVVGSVGPEGGFRLNYRRIENDYFWQFIPVSRQLGEPIEEALAEGSDSRKALAGFRPDRATVTFWTYPDSFAAYRRLKEEVYLLGFPVAGRPLPQDQHISGSTRGSKSAAQ